MLDKTKIIDLSELREDDEFPAYVAIYSPSQTESLAEAFSLSPESMRWNENILLSSLESCQLFWLNQKKKLRCKLTELFDPLLHHHYGDGFIAVFGNHPWQCLIYLYYQIEHQGQGIYLLQSRLNQSIFKSLDWDCWFRPQQDLYQHFETINARGFRQDSICSRQAQMKRFIQRIAVMTPCEMNQADSNSITRRFGKWMGLIWQWSFSADDALNGFPWIKHKPDPLPAVGRELEYPVNQWSCIEVLLREDLTRLSESIYRSENEHINRMTWEVTLFNYQKIRVELSFRHPYSLHRDLPEFNTALYQARYIFDDMMLKLSQRDSDLDLPETMPFIGWRIEICERIQLAPQLWDLFARETEQIDYQQLMALQNKLPTAFECYQSEASFYPEQSFRACALNEKPVYDFDHSQWSESSINKPLFYYQDVLPIDPPDRMRRFFLERNSSQWWLGHDSLQSIRDYFLLQDYKGRASWIFRNADGEWFKQGEFC